ncbi:hypothetical protein C0991_009926, partial [Blastosporella zonata]
MVFKNSPRFIFHNSRGFKAGNTEELSYVKSFIVQRAKRTRLRDRVHAIWYFAGLTLMLRYCIPLNNNRPVTKAKDTFFSKCGTGHVPVIVLFTKLDALNDKGFQLLQKENPDISHDNAADQAPIRAQQIFDEMLLVLCIFKSRYPPKNYVALRGMTRNSPQANCGQLLELTAAALDNETLQLLFVATQQANLELCMTHAIG